MALGRAASCIKLVHRHHKGTTAGDAARAHLIDDARKDSGKLRCQDKAVAADLCAGVQFHCGADQRDQRLLIDLVAL
jgi:hypothetical protein